MNTSNLPWHEQQWQTVEQWFKTQQCPHAILICGVPDVGKQVFAARLIDSLLCHSPAAQRQACGTCRSCALRLAGTHPDFCAITPHDNKKSIGIDDIRELISHLSLTASHSQRKIAQIFPADAMTTAAANSLLKTLEEPPGDTVIVLVCDHTSRLPKTILSRCQRLTFAVPQRQVVTEWLEQRAPDATVANALVRERGRPLAALRRLTGTAAEGQGTDVVDSVVGLMSQTLSPIQIAKQWQSCGVDDITERLLEVVGALIKSKMITNSATRGGLEGEQSMQDLANQLDLFRLFELLDELHHRRYQYLTHGGLNEQLGLEALAIKCVQTHQSCLNQA